MFAAVRALFFILVLLSTSVLAAIPIGYHDTTDNDKIRGWTCDPDDYNAALWVHVYDQFGYVGAAQANVYRGDVGSAGVCGGTSYHGFEFYYVNANRNLRDNQTHTFSTYAIDPGNEGNPLLTMSPQSIFLAGDSVPLGYHDTTDDQKVRGWACDPDNFNAPLTVAIQDAAGLIGYATASDYRSDLAAACANNPNHAFTFSWAQAQRNVQDNQYHQIYAYAIDAETGQWRQLNNSPQTVFIPAVVQQVRITDPIDTGSFNWVEANNVAAPAANDLYSYVNVGLSDLIESYTGLRDDAGPLVFRVDNTSAPTTAVQVRSADNAMGVYLQTSTAGLHSVNPTDGAGPLYWPFPNGTGHLDLSFDARATTLSGLAYGHATIAFFDTGCTRAAGCDWYLTIGTFGYDSLYGPAPRQVDPGTGFPIMTTYFGADPMWGTTVDGNASTCSGGDMRPVCTSLTHFEFRIDASQFQNIINNLSFRFAGFTTNVANYKVHDFHFNNEISGAGALGMTLRNATLKSYY